MMPLLLLSLLSLLLFRRGGGERWRGNDDGRWHRSEDGRRAIDNVLVDDAPTSSSSAVMTRRRHDAGHGGNATPRANLGR
jgi:hypothetical protein